jgi:hypothetical protein
MGDRPFAKPQDETTQNKAHISIPSMVFEPKIGA